MLRKLECHPKCEEFFWQNSLKNIPFEDPLPVISSFSRKLITVLLRANQMSE